MSQVITPEEFAKELDSLVGKKVLFEWCIENDEYGIFDPVYSTGKFLGYEFFTNKGTIQMEFRMEIGTQKDERHYFYVPTPPYNDKIFKEKAEGYLDYRLACSETSESYAIIRVEK